MIFPFPNVDLGIAVISVLQNMRGSTLGKEGAHLSENKGEKSEYEKFSKKFRKDELCFNELFIFGSIVTNVFICSGDKVVQLYRSFALSSRTQLRILFNEDIS